MYSDSCPQWFFSLVPVIIRIAISVRVLIRGRLRSLIRILIRDRIRIAIPVRIRGRILIRTLIRGRIRIVIPVRVRNLTLGYSHYYSYFNS